MFLYKSDGEKRGNIFDDCILDGSPLTLMILQRHFFEVIQQCPVSGSEVFRTGGDDFPKGNSIEAPPLPELLACLCPS
jgi:hypothetical protein